MKIILGDHSYDHEVAGESAYQTTLRVILDHFGPRARESVPMLLVAEPDNPHDRNAVSVRMSEDPSDVIGYLPRDDAAEFRRCTRHLGTGPFVCRGRLIGGGPLSGPQGGMKSIGVLLDIEAPYEVQDVEDDLDEDLDDDFADDDTEDR